MPENESITFTISRKDWRNALTAVLAHAGTDRSLPVIAAVQIECDGKGLTFVGTDRFTLGVHRHDFPSDLDEYPEPFAFLLDRNDAADSVALYKPERRGIIPLRVTVEAERMVLHDDTPEPSLTLSAKRAGFGAEFPKWRKIMESIQAKDKGLTEGIALNPHYLARWAKATSLNEPVRILAHGETGALLVSVGPDFFGVQMPVRLSDSGQTAMFDAERWQPILDAAPLAVVRAA